ncbi:MAG: carboxypeptidase regulatory-like domain-containing protein [Thermoguttaceae bacterium]
MKNLVFASVLFCVVSLSIVGCAEKVPSDVPQLYPTSLTITLDGSPIEGAVVSFTGENPGTLPVGGSTNASGVVEMFTNGRYKGAPVGKYKVTISKRQAVEGPTSKTPAPTDPAELDKYKRAVSNERKYVELVAPEFLDPGKTPLAIEVTNGKNQQTFDVKRDPSAKL